MNHLIVFLSFLLALGMALYFVPVMRRAALKWGVVDKPDGRLKTQREPVAYLGGVGVYLAFLLSLAFVFDFSPQVLGLLLGGTIMLLIGLVDDFGVLTPFQKLAGQGLAIFVLIKAGIHIRVEFLPVWFAIPLTVFWMLAVINAVNILDVSDGLASGVALVACLCLLVVVLVNENFTIATLTAALAGALAGFLVFNFHPAKIYLGDTGSLFVGLMLGALAMIASYSRTNYAAYIAPVLLLAVPIFETAFVMAMRAKKRLPVFLGSPDHFAIRLKRRGFTAPQVAFIAYGAGALAGGAAILNLFVSPPVSLWIGAVAVLVALILFIILNRMEP